jgi:ADP-ribose pyrophosphatase YjhB (NUDIX family)
MEAVVVIPRRKDGRGLIPFIKRGWCENWHAGSGGKVKQGETLAQTCVRELKEELCIEVDPTSLEQFAVIEDLCRLNLGGYAYRCKVFFFWAYRWEGVEQITDEADPTEAWFEISAEGMPWDKLYPSYRTIFPPLIGSDRTQLTLTCIHEENDPHVISEMLFLPASSVLEPCLRN